MNAGDEASLVLLLSLETRQLFLVGSFGGNGFVTLFGVTDPVTGLELLPNGSILATGSGFAIEVRPDGSYDDPWS